MQCSAHLINDRGLQIDKDCPGHVLPAARLGEERVETGRMENFRRCGKFTQRVVGAMPSEFLPKVGFTLKTKMRPFVVSEAFIGAYTKKKALI